MTAPASWQPARLPRTRSFRRTEEGWAEMFKQLIWLTQVLEAAGLKVDLLPGWENREQMGTDQNGTKLSESLTGS